MKIIGLIGGMSWESSAVYYRLLNERVGSMLGGSHSCECIMDSVDFDPVERLQHQGKWKELCDIMRDKALKLEKGGCTPPRAIICVSGKPSSAISLSTRPISVFHFTAASPVACL